MRESLEPAPPLSFRSRARRALSRLYRGWGFTESGCRDISRLLAFLAWAGLARVGLARKRVMLMNCAEGREGDGFYAQFSVILGLLEHCERWKGVIAGVKVDFGDWDLYFDASAGNNSWEYFFQPIDFRRESGAVERVVDREQGQRFAVRGETMLRTTAFGLISRHIRVRPHIQEKIDAFARANFRGFDVIGVHYRGTDKWEEARRVPYEEVRSAIREAIIAREAGAFRLFVASDEQAFVEYMERSFPGRVISWETRRSLDGEPIDFVFDDNYKKGEDAVIDCLLLSRCHHLIRTSSTLSLCSTYFNPKIPVVVLNQHYSGLQPSPR